MICLSHGGEMQYTVSVVGLGKVGLPLAVQYAGHGAHVIGCDINSDVVAEVNSGRTPIGDEAELEERLLRAHQAGRIEATTDTSEAVSRSNVVVIIVPLMVNANRAIDFRFIDAATESVGRGLKLGTVVIYETTLPLGTTRDRNAKNLEVASGMVAGKDFHVAFSPERIRTGRIFRDLATYPKVVGGLTPEGTDVAAAFYKSVLDADVMRVASAESAELTKLMETTYRDVNIALANEFAVFAAERGIDVYEGIEAANSQPQSHIHQPGIGVGGHCIPVYPYFMINNAHEDEVRLARQAREINDGMSRFAISTLSEPLSRIDDKRAVVLGLSYRANVKESAFSIAFYLVGALQEAGFSVDVCDPMFTDDEIRARGLNPVTIESVDSYPVVAIQALHDDLIPFRDTGFPRACVVIDGRSDLGETGAVNEKQVYFRVGSPLKRP